MASGDYSARLLIGKRSRSAESPVLCELFYDTVRLYRASDGRARGSGEDLERSGCGLTEIFRRLPGEIEESHENLSTKTVFRSLFIPSKSQAQFQRLTTTLTSSAIQFDVLCELESPTPRTKRSESQSVHSSSSSEIKNSPKWISIIPS
jgi:hypothetical protein